MDLSIRYGREVLFCCPKFVLWTICGHKIFRPRTKQSDEWFVPTVLLIFQKQFGIHYIRRNSCCPMDSHTDSPLESPKPYRNRNRYLYILYLLCSLSYGRISIIVLEFSKLFRKNKDIPIDMVQGCVIVRSQKSKGGTWYEYYSKRTDR